MPEGARWERHHVMYHRKDWLRTRGSKLLRLAMIFRLPSDIHRKMLHQDIPGEQPPSPDLCYQVLNLLTAPQGDLCRLEQALHGFDDLSLSGNSLEKRRQADRMAMFLHRQRGYVLLAEERKNNYLGGK